MAVKIVVAPKVNDFWGSGVFKGKSWCSWRDGSLEEGGKEPRGVQRQLQTPIPGRWITDVWPRAAAANVKQKIHLLLVSLLNHFYFCPKGRVSVWSDWCCHSSPSQNRSPEESSQDNHSYTGHWAELCWLISLTIKRWDAQGWKTIVCVKHKCLSLSGFAKHANVLRCSEDFKWFWWKHWMFCQRNWQCKLTSG